MSDASWTALGSASRRRILEELAKGEKTVTELTEACKLSQPTTSQHLGILRDAGLVSGRSVPRGKEGGAWRIYRLERAGLEAMLEQYYETLGLLILKADSLALGEQLAAD